MSVGGHGTRETHIHVINRPTDRQAYCVVHSCAACNVVCGGVRACSLLQMNDAVRQMDQTA